jgi:PAP2 superfamily
MSSRVRVSVVAVVVAFGIAAWPAGSIRPVEAAPLNMAVEWNRTMLSAFAAANVPAPAANRLGAVVQAAVFDAVNGIQRRYQPIHVQPAAPEDASPKAAAAAAAHEALVTLFPGQSASLDAAFAGSLQAITEGGDVASIADGIAWGKTVADDVLAWRATDGFNAPPPPYVFSTEPGQWQPTPGGTGAPRFRTLATTTPFGLTSPSQFRPAGPPALSSARYTQDFHEVKALGGLGSTVRTDPQTQTAIFWQVDTPVAMWDRVADSLAVGAHLDLLRTARLLALVNISIADALIAVFDAKNAFNSWRPVTAIVAADLDGNPATAADPTWLPLLVTPYFQEYPSAHSGVSSAAASVLASVFGDDTSFTVTSAGLPGVERSFTSFAAAVEQVADARVWAGFHFRFACDDAAVMGTQVANYVASHVMLPARD